MADCECLPRCPFFNDKMHGLETIKEMLKKNYCKSDFSQCARYLVFKAKGRENVPIDLYPNQQDRAKAILRG